MPCTPASSASFEYTGLTSWIFFGGLTSPPTRTGACPGASWRPAERLNPTSIRCGASGEGVNLQRRRASEAASATRVSGPLTDTTSATRPPASIVTSKIHGAGASTWTSTGYSGRASRVLLGRAASPGACRTTTPPPKTNASAAGRREGPPCPTARWSGNAADAAPPHSARTAAMAANDRARRGRDMRTSFTSRATRCGRWARPRNSDAGSRPPRRSVAASCSSASRYCRRPPSRRTTCSSTNCSRERWIWPVSHQAAGWNQASDRTISSPAARSQSRRRTCSSSWQAMAFCWSCGKRAKSCGTRTTGRAKPKVIGRSARGDTRNSASAPAASTASSTARVRGHSRAAPRRRRDRTTRPSPSQARRRAAPAARTPAGVTRGRSPAVFPSRPASFPPAPADRSAVTAGTRSAAAGSARSRATRGCSSGSATQAIITRRQYVSLARGEKTPSRRGSGAAARARRPACAAAATRLSRRRLSITAPPRGCGAGAPRVPGRRGGGPPPGGRGAAGPIR